MAVLINTSIGQRKRKGKIRQREVRETKTEDIKVKITFTPGYQQRFTEACLRQLERRQQNQELQSTAPWKTDKDSMPKVSA
jgi:Flp pilus assembly protein TadB